VKMDVAPLVEHAQKNLRVCGDDELRRPSGRSR
jgi:hypothetical protein